MAPVSLFASMAPRIDDKQVKIMIWPELELDSKSRVQFDFEHSSVKEKVYSNRINDEISVNELPTYAVSVGTSLGKNFSGGIQFGPTRLIFLNFSLNFNIQYNVYKDSKFLFGIVGMYGGVIFPGERFGAKLLLSYKDGEFTYYSSYEKIKSYRYFQSGKYDNTTYLLDNSLKYNLVSDIFSIGLRTDKIGEILGNNKLLFDFGLGIESDDNFNYYSVKYEPANFKREAGLITSISAILLY